ncbi:MAG TPA: hypothetical protein VHE81_06940 [Lacipirellulaceae bacterium]|nr:hypothetical protein [Lacipirellulaceae bacterium]
MAEDRGNLSAYGLVVCVHTASIIQIEKTDLINIRVAEAVKLFDYGALCDAARMNGWTDESPIPDDDFLRPLWPNGTPPGWPDE